MLQQQEHTFPGKELPSALARNEAATAQVKDTLTVLKVQRIKVQRHHHWAASSVTSGRRPRSESAS